MLRHLLPMLLARPVLCEGEAEAPRGGLDRSWFLEEEEDKGDKLSPRYPAATGWCKSGFSTAPTVCWPPRLCAAARSSLALFRCILSLNAF